MRSGPLTSPLFLRGSEISDLSTHDQAQPRKQRMQDHSRRTLKENPSKLFDEGRNLFRKQIPKLPQVPR
jgi:hypothetical protein